VTPDADDQPRGPAPAALMPARLRALLQALRGDLAVLVVLTVLTLAVAHPAALQPGSRVIGWPGDNLQHVYAVGWMAQAALLGRSPFIDPRLNFPDGLQLMTTDLAYLSNLVVAPATWLFGPVFGYNLIILASLLLSGYIAYRWVLQLTASRAGGLVAGAAFLLAPYRIAHAYGHLQLVVTFPLPLYFWALDGALRARRVSSWHQARLAAAALLLSATSQYYLVIGLVGALAYGSLSLPVLDWRAGMRRGAAAALTSGMGALLGALPYLAALSSRSFTPYPIAATRVWSADPLNFLLPAPYHPLWGQLVAAVRPEPYWIEKGLYVGIVALVLASYALVAGRATLHGRAAPWAATALVGLIFALGTDVHRANVPLSADAPIWLPAYYLGHLPGLSLMRVWARFGVLTILFVALLAGAGAAALVRRTGPRAAPVGVTLLLLIVLDMAPGRLPSALIGPRPADRWLAAQPAGSVAAALPAGDDGVNYRVLLGSLYHGQPMPAFMHPAHVPPAYRRFAQAAEGFPAPESQAALRSLGLRYLVLEQDRFDGVRAPAWPTVRAGLEAAGLAVVAELDGVTIVALP